MIHIAPSVGQLGPSRRCQKWVNNMKKGILHDLGIDRVHIYFHRRAQPKGDRELDATYIMHNRKLVLSLQDNST
jgi:hypothetical protein